MSLVPPSEVVPVHLGLKQQEVVKRLCVGRPPLSALPSLHQLTIFESSNVHQQVDASRFSLILVPDLSLVAIRRHSLDSVEPGMRMGWQRKGEEKVRKREGGAICAWREG